MRHARLASTNDAAMESLRNGDPGGVWTVADEQTGGRGRRGRVWQSPPGNLYASLSLRLRVAPATAPQLGFVAGVALADVLRRRLRGDRRLRIKWPNDMVYGGAKLAGLLLESLPLPEGGIGCVIGFGVNCKSHPEGLPYPATDLATLGDPVPDPSALLDALSNSMACMLAIWNDGAAFDDIRTAWLAHALDQGTPLAIDLAGVRRVGTFQGLDPTGRLLLETRQGRIVVDAGDVFLTDP